MPLERPPVIGAEDANNTDRLRAEWYLMNNHHEAFEDVLSNAEKHEEFRNYLEENDERGKDILFKINVVRGLIIKWSENCDKGPKNLREIIFFLVKSSPQLLKKFDRRDEDFNIHAVEHCTAELKKAWDQKSKKEIAAEKAEALVSAYQETLNAMKKCLQIKSFPLYLEHKASFQPPTFALPEIPENRECRLTSANLLRTQSSRSQHSTREPYYNSNYRPPPTSHNNSEYASQSSDCTSDTLSFTTDSDHFTSEENRRRREKKNRRRMLQANQSYTGKCNLPKYENPKEPEPPKAIDPNLVMRDQKKFHEILCEKLRAYIKKQDQNADDDILDEHIRNKMTTPGSHTPTHRPTVQFPATHHRPHGLHMGPLPSTNPLPAKDLSQDVTGKVTGWLRESDREIERRRASSKTKSKNKHSQSFSSYATNSGYENAQRQSGASRRNQGMNQSYSHENPQSHLSVDSGLSSIRRPEHDDNDFEMRGIKDRLIQETEGEVVTRGLYHYNDEKYVVKVPGRPPTFDAFRKKYHDSSSLHAVRFFFKCEDGAWMEVQNLDEPLPVVNDLVEAKVHEQRLD